MKKVKCQKCQREIKNAYTWKGKTYGIECWKEIALPEMNDLKEERIRCAEKLRKIRYKAIGKVAREKDTSKMRSEFNMSFLKSIAIQVKNKGYISRKQEEILFGTIDRKWNQKFYYGIFNKNDKRKYYEYLKEMNYIKNAEKLEAIEDELYGEVYTGTIDVEAVLQNCYK